MVCASRSATSLAVGFEDRLSVEGCRARCCCRTNWLHLRRRDHWVGWLLLAAGCVWWWHPLFWWVPSTGSRGRAGVRRLAVAAPSWVTSLRRSFTGSVTTNVRGRRRPRVGSGMVTAAISKGDLVDMDRFLGGWLSWVKVWRGADALGLLALLAWTLGEENAAPAGRGRPPGGATPAPAVTTAPEAPPGLFPIYRLFCRGRRLSAASRRRSAVSPFVTAGRAWFKRQQGSRPPGARSQSSRNWKIRFSN